MENAAENYRVKLKPKIKPFEIIWLIFLMVYVGIPAYVVIYLNLTSVIFLLHLLLLLDMYIELLLIIGILWRLFGKEAIEVNDKKLILHYSCLFWHQEDVYQIDKMMNINIDAPHDPFPAIFQKVTGRFGLISFETSVGTEKSAPTGKKTHRKNIRFGYQVDESNAAVIVDKIKNYQNP